MARETDCYCVPHFEDFTLDDQRRVLHSGFSRTLAVLPADALRILRLCSRTLAPLEAHVERCAAALRVSEAQRPALTNLVHALAAVGLLVSEEDVIRKVRSSGIDGESFAPLRTVGIITRHRPDLLERGIATLADNAQRSRRPMTAIVVSDGDEEDDAAAAAALARVRRAYAIESVLIGTAEREALIDALGRHLPGDLVRFALGRPDAHTIAPGAARNLLLLHSRGERLVFVDDDAVGRFAAFGSATEVVLTNRRDPTRFRFFPDRRSSLAEAPVSEDLDFLGVHDRWLGQTPSGWGDLPVFLADPPVALTRLLNGAHPPRVLLTHFGVVGNSGMQRPHYVYTLDGPTRLAMQGLGGDFRRYLLSRDVHRFVERPTISPVGLCMTGCLGIDARGLLPPFAPRFYNEDGTFGSALRATRPDAFTAFLPVSIVHDPAGDRTVPGFDELVSQAVTIRCSDALMLLLGRCAAAPAGVDPAAGLRSIGAQLVALSDSDESFHELVLLTACRERERTLGVLRQAAATLGTDAQALHADLQSLILAYEASLRRPHEGIAIDAGGAPDTSLSRLREYVHTYGRLLQVWPDMMTLARSATVPVSTKCDRVDR